jgi:Zn-dependent protease with chaperone function
MSDLYPAGPTDVSTSLTAPTTAYKHRAWWAVGSLILFIVLYLALTSWFAWTAYRLLHEAITGGTSQFFNFLIGGSAAFLAVFLIKALFFIQRGKTADDIEVTEADQPRLFAFLHRLADEAGAPRPKRVYLSARVNAAVFYDLSILNLIFPSKKNLEIGLALINVLTLSETKAVLAHEFGHFAQRSMAIGSWVYIAQ